MTRARVATFLILISSFFVPTSLHAQDNAELVVQLIERVGNVEAENRELRGQLEEARHELSILQQRMDTLSADVDYRLTNPGSGVPHAQPTPPVAPPAPHTAVSQAGTPASLTAPTPPQGAPLPRARSPVAPTEAPSAPQAVPPVPQSSPYPQVASPEALESANAPLGGNPPRSEAPTSATDEYERARSLLEQGDYDAAERAFAAFVATHPKDKNAGAAQYWLGVTYFVRGQHEKAGATFAKGYKNYPKSSKAADNLLKLAKSLAALNRKANACTTLEQLSSEHPKAHVGEVAREKKNWGCK